MASAEVGARNPLVKFCGSSQAYEPYSVVVARTRPQLIMSGLTLVNAAVSFRKQGGHLRAASVTVCDARHVTHMTTGATANRFYLLPTMKAAELCVPSVGQIVRLAGTT